MHAAYRWGYRPSLTGVRTVAVYLVVAFHAGIATFSGGFIGVDLFFVLSGFLVANVLYTQLARDDSLSMATFYARRFRRLLPAALVTIVVTCLMALVVFAPLARRTLIPDAQAALLYVSNIQQIWDARDYFALDGVESPFLHFWSLSLEEQYYVLFPLMLAAAWRVWRRLGRVSAAMAVLVVPAIVSIGLQVLFASDVSRAYFGTDTRLYQPLAGAILAIWIRFGRANPTRMSAKVATVGAWIGLAGLVVTSTPLVGSPTATTRGLAATAVSLLVIWMLEGNTASTPAKWMAARPMHYLGEVSYGTYLWHWPVIVGITQVADVSPWPLFAIATVVATGLAAGSHRFIETGIRRAKSLDRHPVGVITAGLTLSLVAAVVVVPFVLGSDLRVNLSPGPDPKPTIVGGADDDGTSGGGVGEGAAATGVATAGLDLEEAQRKQDKWHCLDADPGECVLVEGNGVSVHVVGDSHAGALMPGLIEMARDNDLQLSATTESGCPWQFDLYLSDRSENIVDGCRVAREDAYDRVIPALDPDVVVLLDRGRDTPNWLGERQPVVTDNPAYEDDPESLATAATIDALLAQDRRVAAIEPMPEAPFDVPICLSGVDLSSQCDWNDTGGLASESDMRALATQRGEDLVSIDLDAVVCPELPVCQAVRDDLVTFADQHHLASEYAASLAPGLTDRFEASGILAP